MTLLFLEVIDIYMYIIYILYYIILYYRYIQIHMYVAAFLSKTEKQPFQLKHFMTQEITTT